MSVEAHDFPKEAIPQEWACGVCLDSHTTGAFEGHRDPEEKSDHIFHKTCLRKWFTESNTCSLCRKRITIKESHLERTGRSLFLLGFLGVSGIYSVTKLAIKVGAATISTIALITLAPSRSSH